MAGNRGTKAGTHSWRIDVRKWDHQRENYVHSTDENNVTPDVVGKLWPFFGVEAARSTLLRS